MLSLTPFFPNFKINGFRYETINMTNVVSIELISLQVNSACPICGNCSGRRHSSYSRILTDLPLLGLGVELFIACRKLFCDNPKCKQKVFTERFESLVAPYARRTDRLNKSLEIVAFSTNCITGSKLTKSLGFFVSHDLLLNVIRATNIEINSDFKVIGVDDFAFKKGNNYGTIICDLKTKKPIELLRDRTSDELEKWLKEHPQVELVTRDRAGAYAKAISNVSPEIIQVADRFHLVNNLLDALKKFMKNTFASRISITVDGETTEKIAEQRKVVELPKLKKLPEKEKRQKISREKKKELVCEVKQLHEQGMSIRSIAKKMRMSRLAIRRYVKLDTEKAATYSKNETCVSKLDRFRDFIIQEAIFMGKKAASIFRSLLEMGYDGASSTLRCYICKLREEYAEYFEEKEQQFQNAITKTSTFMNTKKWIKRYDIIGYIWSFEEELEKNDKIILDKILQDHTTVKIAHDLVQKFRKLINHRNLIELDVWIENAKAGIISEIASFARGLEATKQEVQNALTFHYSNGPVEGNVNRLKMLKRLMYGRANLDLLSQRVIYQL